MTKRLSYNKLQKIENNEERGEREDSREKNTRHQATAARLMSTSKLLHYEIAKESRLSLIT